MHEAAVGHTWKYARWSDRWKLLRFSTGMKESPAQDGPTDMRGAASAAPPVRTSKATALQAAPGVVQREIGGTGICNEPQQFGSLACRQKLPSRQCYWTIIFGSRGASDLPPAAAMRADRRERSARCLH